MVRAYWSVAFDSLQVARELIGKQGWIIRHAVARIRINRTAGVSHRQ